MSQVLESAARLQQVVSDAVLVGGAGGAAAAPHASQRDSFDLDHVLADLKERFEVVLDVAALAERIGTSTSRLSTYLNGRVAPASTLLVRMERVAGSNTARPAQGTGA